MLVVKTATYLKRIGSKGSPMIARATENKDSSSTGNLRFNQKDAAIWAKLMMMRKK